MIWDEALSVEKNMTISPGGNMSWSMNTSLFLVNKTISAEAIDYFFKKNVFVCITGQGVRAVRSLDHGVALFYDWLVQQLISHAIPLKYYVPGSGVDGDDYKRLPGALNSAS